MNIHYIAGFVDGEGCFYYLLQNRPNKTPAVNIRLFIANKEIVVLEAIKEVYGGSIRAIKNKHSDVHRLEIFDRSQLQRICFDLKDCLIIKKRHAEIMYNFCLKYPGNKRNRYQQEDLDMLNEIRLLNSGQRFRV